MVKEPVRLRFSSVKAVVRSAMGNYRIHGAKIGFYFGLRKRVFILISDFGFSISEVLIFYSETIRMLLFEFTQTHWRITR